MQVIHGATEAYRAMLGQPNMAADSYRVCQFCLSVPTEQGTLFYHTATKELILLSGSLERQPEKIRKELIRRWFLVPADFDEYRWFDQVKGLLRLLRRPGDTMTFTVMTTMDCNARCFYCFEAGRKRIPMSKQTAVDVAAYILRHSKGKKIKLRWYGGEPLMNIPAIDAISQALTDANASFEAMMVTNGYLFTDEVLNKAKNQWGVDHVQITLDGTEQVYNRAKAYVDATGSPYRRVLDNIDWLTAAGITVYVRMNLDRYNAENLLRLCDELAERFPNRENLRAYGELLFDAKGFTPSKEQEKRYADLRRLEEKLESLGMRKPKKLETRVRLEHCMADDDSCVVITPDGRLSKCDLCSEEELFGSIYSEEKDAAMLESWREPEERTEVCASCRLYPSCTRLKKCPGGHSCDEYQRAHMEYKIRQSMLAAYEEWRKTV